MAEAPAATARQSTDDRSIKLASPRRVRRSCRIAYRFAHLSLVVPEHGAQYPCQFRRIEWRRIFGWFFGRRRFFRGWRVVRRRRRFGELVMNISKEDRARI